MGEAEGGPEKKSGLWPGRGAPWYWSGGCLLACLLAFHPTMRLFPQVE